jgi:hypothetical protein
MLRLAADLRESAHGAALMVTAQPQRCYASPTSETALNPLTQVHMRLLSGT